MVSTIVVKGLTPKKAHNDDAAFDLVASHDTYVLPEGDIQLVKCGFSIAIPDGHVGLICSRSGLALNHGVFVLNAPGVIDPGYRGEVGVILCNLNQDFTFQVRKGDRIAQLLILKLPHVFWNNDGNYFDTLSTLRGGGGFGSTGQ